MTIRQRVITQAKKTALLRHRVIALRKQGKNPRVLVKAYHRAKAELVKRRVALALARDPRARLVKYAASFIGVTEHPSGSNGGKFIDGWQKVWGIWRTYWCGAFAGAMLRHVGVKVTARVVYVPNIKADAQNGVNGFYAWTTDHSRVRPGDLVCLFGLEHVEIVRKVTRSGVVVSCATLTAGRAGACE